MPLLVNETAQRAALQFASARPVEGFDPGFAARFMADWRDGQRFHNSEATARNRDAVWQEFADAFRAESGQSLPAPFRGLPAAQGAPAEAEAMAMQRLEEAARSQFDAWKQDNPQSDLVFPEKEELYARADARGLSARREAQALASRSSSWRSGIGGFAGSMASALTDPINIISLGFGATAASGILRTALVEGFIGATSEAAIQAATFDDKQRIDPSFTAGEAVSEVVAAAAGGALFGGGVRGLASIWHRAKTGTWPRHTRDVGNIVSREAAVPPSRIGKSAGAEATHRGALEKAADDLARNRPVELPPDLFTRANARPGRVYDADGRSVGVTYELAEADSLVTSHDGNLNPNPLFPPELQPRDRSRALSRDQVSAIAANLQPERLGPSPQADSGAPIVGPDGIVESGNGRVLALRRAFDEGGIPAENYRNFLRSQGFDLDGFRNPVLVAKRVTDLDEQARVGFVTAANRATAMRLGAGEQALADARLIDNALMERLEGSDVEAAGNRRFVSGFLQRLPRAEQGELVDKSGALSQAGERRITAALMGRAYGEPVLLGRALEDADSNIKALAGALADAAVPWVRMRDAVASGAIPRGMDVTDDLLEAMRLVMKARDEGVALRDLVNQAEMFGGPSEIAKLIARSMFNEDMTRAVSRRKVARFLADYADEARKNDAGDRLFGEALENRDILKTSLERVGRMDLRDVAAERLTRESVEEIAAADDVVDAVIMEGERIRAEMSGVRVDLGDGVERSLDEIFDEADEEIAAAADIEGCALGRTADAAE